MTNKNTSLLGDTSHLDPEVAAAREQKLIDEGIRKTHGLRVDLDPTKRKEVEDRGTIQKSAQNPEGKAQHENTGTPQLTERELADRVIIRAAREQRSNIVAGIRKLEQKALSNVNKYSQFIVDAAAAIDDVSDPIVVIDPVVNAAEAIDSVE